MPLNIDTTRALRTVPELLGLINSIHAGRREDETDAVEWKGPVDDVAAKRWIVEVARHAIGMGNRDPDAAAGVFESCGYIVLGVEPGSLTGVGRLDPADADNKLLPYLARDGPRCKWETLDFHGVDVAVVTVEPPTWGDRMHNLRRAFHDSNHDYAEGDVFVRRHGKTVRAGSADIDRLTQRALQRRERLDLRVAVSQPAPLMLVVNVDPSMISTWITGEVNTAVEGASEIARQEHAGKSTASLLGVPLAALDNFGRHPDPRTVESFAQEYAEWEASVQTIAPGFVRDRAAIVDASARLMPTVINSTDHNFANVKIQVDVVTPGVSIHLPALNSDRCELPEQPRAYGPRSDLEGLVISSPLTAIAAHTRPPGHGLGGRGDPRHGAFSRV